MLKEYLSEEVERWAFIGHPALLQRFVLRNGFEFKPVKRIGRRGTPKQCFMNATKAVLKHVRAYHQLEGWQYVEGYAIHRERPLLAFHHAWVTTGNYSAMDVTLEDAADYEYYGVAFDRRSLVRELDKQDHYGLLDTGLGLNWRLMFKRDPDLKGIVENIKPRSEWIEAMKKTKETAI